MKRALITGGSGTIGAAICRVLAQEGCHVIVHAHHHPESAAQIADEIIETGGSAEAICFDVSNPDAARDALESLLESGPIQVLVNNAGVHDDAPMAGMSTEQWHHVVNVSLNGFFNVTQPLLLPMMKTRWGRIISLSSVAGVMGNRGQANYAAAKSGLHGAAKSLAREVASRGITVNVIAPGVIESPMKVNTFNTDQIKAIVPMQRAGKPEEIAHLAAFLASEKAAYVSGQIISINGAMC